MNETEVGPADLEEEEKRVLAYMQLLFANVQAVKERASEPREGEETYDRDL
jgi:hypothetical protein